MRALSILLLLGCGEWALIFRAWVSFRYLILYAGAAYLRLFYFLHYLPHWDTNYILFPVSVLALLYHIRLLFRGGTSHNQQTYDTPETGVPWLVIVARSPKRALLLELSIIALAAWYMARYGNLVYPPGFRHLPEGLQAWLAAEHGALVFVFQWTYGTILIYMLWHQAVSGVPFWPEGKPRIRMNSASRYVRVQDRPLPQLPGAKELSDDLGEFHA